MKDIKKSVKARTTAQAKRKAKSAIDPTYGKPKQSAGGCLISILPYVLVGAIIAALIILLS